jgi:hypothetical protein
METKQMYNVNGFLRLPSRRGRRQMLDLRAPEDQLLNDDDISNVRRSPAVSDWIDAYHSADQEDDGQGRVEALMKVIDANRADMAASGVPVFAHSPLPDDFAAELARDQSRSGFTDLLTKIDPSVRRLVAHQLVQGPAGGGRYVLLGGDDGDSGGGRGSSPRDSRGQSPGAQPTPREKPPVPGPVMPRPHPDSEQREQERKQKCQSLRQEHADLRRTIKDYEGLKTTAEFRQNVHRQNRANLLRLLADVEARLNEARSRSTDPGDYYFVCPGDKGSRKGLPRGKGRRGDWIRDGLCEVLGPIVGEQAKERERRRLEDEKARDIRTLQAEHSQLKQKVAATEQGMKDEQREIDDAKDALHWHYLKLSEISDNYKTNCGNPRELWPY